MQALRKIADFQVDDLGMENSQYFQGYGTSSSFTHSVVGIGDNPKEALDDCLDQIATGFTGIDIDDLEGRIFAQYPGFIGDEAELPSVYREYGEDCEDIYYYIGIKWNLSKE